MTRQFTMTLTGPDAALVARLVDDAVLRARVLAEGRYPKTVKDEAAKNVATYERIRDDVYSQLEEQLG